MSFLTEFKAFAMKGNVVDMAVGVIIGAGFGKIVDSLVRDVIMPPISFLMGGVDFSDWIFTIKDKTETAKAISINYGTFITTILDFTILAFAIFMLIKQINRFKKEAPQEVITKECPRCFSQISLQATRCPHCTSEI